MFLALLCVSCAGTGARETLTSGDAPETRTVTNAVEPARAAGTGHGPRTRFPVGLALQLVTHIADGWRWERAEDRAFRELDVEPPGAWVEVNGRRLHVVSRGTGSPGVLLLAGSPEDHRSWKGVQDLLATEVRTVSYDRPGLGWSPATGSPQTTFHEALDDVRALISEAGLFEGPVVVVGHSHGGLLARELALQHPELVAGVVLVDPSTVEGIPERGLRELRQIRVQGALHEELGWKRLRFYQDHPELGPEQLRSEYHRRRGSRASRVLLADFLAFSGVPPLAGPGALGSMPVTVLSAPRVGSAPSELQRRMAALSTVGHFVPADTGHHVHQDDPELFLSEVRRIIRTVRDG